MNNNIHRIIFFFFLAVINFCCGNPGHGKKLPYQFYDSDFKIQTSLNGQIFKLTNVSYPVDMCIVPDQNILLVTDNNNPISVNVYDLGTMKFIRSFIEKGVKPYQQIISRNLQYDAINKLLYSADIYKKKIFVYPTTDLRNVQKKIYPVEDITFKSESFLRPLILPENRIVDFHENNNLSPKGVLDFFRKDSDLLTTKGSYPAIKPVYRVDQLNFAFFSCMTLSKDQRHLIINYFHTDYIDIYDLDGNLQKRKQGPDIFDPLVKTVTVPTGTMNISTHKSVRAYAAKPYMDKNNVYVLYSGEKKNGDYHANTLFNFSSDLIPKTKLTLNVPIFAFDIDPKTNILYGLANQSTGSYIIKFLLP